VPASDEVWSRIAEGCIRRCEAVDCTLEEFNEGLTQVIMYLSERRSMVLMEIEDGR
jgi:hypothetical protein